MKKLALSALLTLAISAAFAQTVPNGSVTTAKTDSATAVANIGGRTTATITGATGFNLGKTFTVTAEGSTITVVDNGTGAVRSSVSVLRVGTTNNVGGGIGSAQTGTIADIISDGTTAYVLVNLTFSADLNGVPAAERSVPVFVTVTAPASGIGFVNGNARYLSDTNYKRLAGGYVSVQKGLRSAVGWLIGKDGQLLALGRGVNGGAELAAVNNVFIASPAAPTN